MSLDFDCMFFFTEEDDNWSVENGVFSLWDQKPWLKASWHSLCLWTKQILPKPWKHNNSMLCALENKIIFLKCSHCCQGIFKLKCHEDIQIPSGVVNNQVASSHSTNSTRHHCCPTPVFCYLNPAISVVTILAVLS